MLVCKVNPSSIDSPGNFLANLVGVSPCNHIQLCPSVFYLGTDRCTDKEVEFFLGRGFGLQVVGLDMVCYGLYTELDEMIESGIKTYRWNQLGVSDASESGPANLQKE